MSGRWIPISKPVLGPEEIEAVSEVLESGQLVQGPKVEEFEKNFAQYVGARHAVAVSSGTAALHLALIALGVRPGDEVVTTPLSFFSSVSSAILIGARPVFADVQQVTHNLDPETLKHSITPKTKTIEVVHLHGHPADMGPISELAEERGIPVLEDAAQAHGAEYKGKKAGSLGRAAAFSFYPSKNMTTGEGGIVVTDDEEIAEMVSLLRNHGQVKRYDHRIIGFNYRMTEIQAAIGTVQLEKLHGFLEVRREVAMRYSDELSGIEGLHLPLEEKWAKHSWYLYAIRSSGLERDQLVIRMREKGIDARPTYPCPIQGQPAMESLGDPCKNLMASHFSGVNYGEVKTPVAEKLTRQLFYIPLNCSLTPDQVQRVIVTLREACHL